MKIVLVNRFFYPDSSATSQIATDLAFHLAARGHDVHVVTGRSAQDLPVRELCGHVEVHRICKPAHPGQGLVRRLRDYICFYWRARKTVSRLISAGDVVIAKTDPPMLMSALARSVWKANARMVAWLQDLFPEVAQQYGIRFTRGVPGTVLCRLRDHALKNAACVVAIGDRMASLVAARSGVDPMRVHVVHNWADEGAIIPIKASSCTLRRQWGLEDKLVVAYSGNLGRVHEFETLVGAAELLRSDNHVLFIVIGRGPRLDDLKNMVAARQLNNVRFQPPQARASLRDSLGVADLHLCVLRPEFEGLVVPSKLYGIMAAGRPTIFVGAEDSECADVLRRHQAGVSVKTGDSIGLARAIQNLATDEVRRTVMGSNARKAFEDNYAMSIALKKWEQILEGLQAQ